MNYKSAGSEAVLKPKPNRRVENLDKLGDSKEDQCSSQQHKPIGLSLE